jgi:hypothetical protein
MHDQYTRYTLLNVASLEGRSKCGIARHWSMDPEAVLTALRLSRATQNPCPCSFQSYQTHVGRLRRWPIF